MIDIHSHIVFEVDDGSKSIEQSVEMLQEASNAGVKKVIVTPHYIEEYYEIEKGEIAEKIEKLKEQLENINCNIEILQGNEIYITNNINELLEISLVLSIGSILLSIVLLCVHFSLRIKDNTKYYAILCCCGYSRKKIFAMVTAELVLLIFVSSWS